MRLQSLIIGGVAALFLVTVVGNGQQLQIAHARLDQSSSSAGLKAAIASATKHDSGALWIGYECRRFRTARGKGTTIGIIAEPIWKKVRTSLTVPALLPNLRTESS